MESSKIKCWPRNTSRSSIFQYLWQRNKITQQSTIQNGSTFWKPYAAKSKYFIFIEPQQKQLDLQLITFFNASKLHLATKDYYGYEMSKYRMTDQTDRSARRFSSFTPEVLNMYSEWWDSSHIYNFWCIYAFILILHSNFEVLILHILNNTHDVVDFDSPRIDIYKNQKLWMIGIRTVQYSVKGCVFCVACCLCLFLSSIFVNAATTKTVMNVRM